MTHLDLIVEESSGNVQRNKAGQFLTRPANSGRKKGFANHKTIALAFREAGKDIGLELLSHYNRLLTEDKNTALALLKHLLPYVYAAKKVDTTVDDIENDDDVAMQKEQEAAELEQIISDRINAA